MLETGHGLVWLAKFIVYEFPAVVRQQLDEFAAKQLFSPVIEGSKFWHGGLKEHVPRRTYPNPYYLMRRKYLLPASANPTLQCYVDLE